MPTSQIERGHSRLLAIETPTALGHTSTLTIVDAANAPHRLNAALLRQEVNARLDDHPMLRQSLAAVPLNLDRPWWRDHPGFDLNYHLRH
ncbi:MAG TPA: wax ester/triacylglycerol synthase domain-containing protein, partial [Ilumatobacteraceae bacterium]|nr:wax ester/triacylglycerol synthase domain-containing protein [Ilumatobacteraceae bacterium]